MIDMAVRQVEFNWPRSMELLIEGHSLGQPIDDRCVACADIVTQIRAQFARIAAEM